MEIKKNIKLILLTLGLIGVALLAVFWKNSRDQESAKLNHTYEVSLVKALKNSYAGIEEIRMTNPEYSEIPGAWSCDIEIKFVENVKVSYRIGHDLDWTQNYQGSRQSDKDWEYLESHKGVTNGEVKVYYSNSKEGKQ